MANIGIDFDSSNVEPQKPMESTPLPAGKYIVAVVQSDVKSTKRGDGSYAEFVLEVIDGEYAKRKLWSRITLQNHNQQAVDIGRSQLSALCRAVGHVGKLNDTDELLNRTLIVTVKVKKRDDNGEFTNEVSGYEAADGSTQAAKPQAVASAPKPAGGSMPWMRK